MLLCSFATIYFVFYITRKTHESAKSNINWEVSRNRYVWPSWEKREWGRGYLIHLALSHTYLRLIHIFFSQEEKKRKEITVVYVWWWMSVKTTHAVHGLDNKDRIWNDGKMTRRDGSQKNEILYMGDLQPSHNQQKRHEPEPSNVCLEAFLVASSVSISITQLEKRRK